MIKTTLLFSLLLFSTLAWAQPSAPPSPRNLDKRVSLNIRQEPICAVLEKLSKAGEFYFSYSGSLFKQDSIVTINAKGVFVRDLLDQLFRGKVDYRETGEYIILRYAANHLTIEPENITSADQLYLISGFVTDIKTGKRIKQASVYEKRLLQSTLTDDNGFFKLRFKGEHREVVLTASKDTYRDTTLIFLSDITVKPGSYQGDDGEVNAFYNSVETSGLGRFFISSKQRIQNMNIPNFFAYSPFQASLTPGLSSHGMMSTQVVNKFSLNVLGGYTAGSNGLEIAGLFNINKGDMSKLQFAGLFNVVGGKVNGIQMAGLVNDVQGSQKGLQAAGLINHNRRDVNGILLAGLMNINHDRARGIQAAGLANIIGRSPTGVHLAGMMNVSSGHTRAAQAAALCNIALGKFDGIQISGLVNYARNMNGVQIGLINVSDTSSGYSIGLINLVKHGYHQLSIYATDITNTNLSYKTGNSKIYSKIYAGYNISETEQVAMGGLGLGHDFVFSSRVSLGAELSFHYLYLGNWDYGNTLTRLQTNVQVQISRRMGIFAGPAYNYYNSDAPMGSSSKNFKQQVYPNKHHDLGSNNKGWFGFNAGITFM